MYDENYNQWLDEAHDGGEITTGQYLRWKAEYIALKESQHNRTTLGALSHLEQTSKVRMARSAARLGRLVELSAPINIIMAEVLLLKERTDAYIDSLSSEEIQEMKSLAANRAEKKENAYTDL